MSFTYPQWIPTSLAFVSALPLEAMVSMIALAMLFVHPLLIPKPAK